jgi:hypothetical protein
MPERLRVMTQTKKGTLFLPVGCWAYFEQPHPVNIFDTKLEPKPQNVNQKIIKTLARDFGFGTWNVRAVLRPVSIKEFVPQIKQYSIHVMAIQDTGWQGEVIIDLKTHMLLKKKGKGKGKAVP